MTRRDERQTDPITLLRASKAHRKSRRNRHKRRPCGGNLPEAPTGLQITFDKTHKTRRRRWEGVVVWNEVTLNEAGASTQAERYIVQWQHSDDGANPVGPTRRRVIAAKDEDSNTTASMVFRAARRYYYRARVRAVNKDGCRGAFSAWTAWQRPGAEAPPAPTDVTIYEETKGAIGVVWDAPADPNDADLIDADIDHFQVQVATNVGFSALYHFDRRVNHMRFTVPVRRADQDLTFYARVRSVNSEGDKSAWIPARILGNSNPGATPDGISPLRDKVIAVFTKHGPVVAKHYSQLWTADRRYKFRKVRVRFGRHVVATHPDDGCPQGSDAVIQVFWHSSDESSEAKLFALDDRLRVPANEHKDTAWASDLLITHLEEDEHLSVKVTSVGSSSPGQDMVVQVVMVPD